MKKKVIRDYKQAIIQYVTNNAKELARTFTPAKKKPYLNKALQEKNWVRVSKYHPISYDYEIVHEFDCRPYNKELKAYVYTDTKEKEILNVIVQTE